LRLQRYCFFLTYASKKRKKRVGVYGFLRRYAPNNPQTLLGGVSHNLKGREA